MATSRTVRRSRFTLVLLILTSVTLLSLDVTGFGPLDGVRRGVISVTSPVRSFFGDILSPVGDAWSGAFDGGELEKENERLRQEVAELRGQVAEEESARATLEQLLTEVDIEFVGAIDTVVARIVAGPVGNTVSTREIDKGSKSGIRDGMAVVTGGGLIGSVDLSTPSRSVVRLVDDAGFRLGVRVDEQILGVVSGQGPGELLEGNLSFDSTRPVEKGMLVTTSGLERSLFPPGLPVGEVVSATIAEDGLTQVVEVELFADLEALGFVNVMLWEPIK